MPPSDTSFFGPIRRAPFFFLRAPAGASGRRLPLAAMLLVLMGASGCFQPPVVERLSLVFLPEGGVRVAVSRRVEKPAPGPNAALEARLEETRRSLLEGRDAWSRCFEALRPEEETLRWEKRGGELARHERSALLGSPDALGEFFARTPLRVGYRERDGVAAFTVFPAAVSRATREQRERVGREMGAWSAAVAAYLGEASELYAYLGERPDRSEACFGELLVDILSERDREGRPRPDEGEEERLKPLEEAMAAVLSALRVPEGEAHTLDELAQLVYSPFPGEFTVEVPAPLGDVEGFERTGERTARIPPSGLWGAYTAVRRRWIEPDPLQAYLEGSTRKAGEGEFDLAAFSALPRSVQDLPDPGEVRSVLEQALSPKDLYRVAWPLEQ